MWRFTYRVGTTSRTTFAQQEAGKLHLGQREGRGKAGPPLTLSADNKICDDTSPPPTTWCLVKNSSGQSELNSWGPRTIAESLVLGVAGPWLFYSSMH